MIVMKFGGTSMGNREAILRCAELVERAGKETGSHPLVVVSAYSKITDMLLEAARKAPVGEYQELYESVVTRHNEILGALALDPKIGQEQLGELLDLLRGIHMVRETTPRLYDYVASFGERLSARTFAAVLRKRGHDCEAFDAWDLGMRTDSNFMNARPLPEIEQTIPAAFEKHKHKLVVITGFIGKDKNGDITTNGRSGTDFTAALFGAALGVSEIQVWKDVPGVMSTDPRMVKDALPIARLGFAEARELAFYGAEVLHPATMVPAMKKGIPARVKNTFDPDAPGTLILPKGEVDPQRPVKVITYKKNQVMINVVSERMLGIEGFMAQLFAIFEKHRVVIDMISTSEVSVSMTTNSTAPEKLQALKTDLERIATVEIEHGKAIIALVGEGMQHTVGLAARAFKAVAEAGVSLQMISQGASEINVTFLIDDAEIARAVRSLHKEFFGV